MPCGLSYTYVSAGYDTLVESSLGAIGVVTTDAEDDGAFLLHRVVAICIGTSAIVKLGETTRLRIAATHGPQIVGALQNSSDESIIDGGVYITRVSIQ